MNHSQKITNSKPAGELSELPVFDIDLPELIVDMPELPTMEDLPAFDIDLDMNKLRMR